MRGEGGEGGREEGIRRTPNHIGGCGVHHNQSSGVVDCETYPRISRFWIVVLAAGNVPRPLCCRRTLQKLCAGEGE